MPMLALIACLSLSPQAAYKNPSLSAIQRATDLVSRMSLDEKISQMQNEAVGIPRLDIPPYDWWSEALHGPIGSPVTVYPQVIGLAATFDPSLVAQIGAAISDEGRARYEVAISQNRHGMHDGLTFWAPNINIVRDPRWGRGQETYGEDPFLTSRMAVAYVKAMQGESGGKLKAVATPKHFAVHSGPDPDRHRFNAVPNKIDLWNFYLPAFRTCVEEGGAWSVMSAYSSLDGVPDSANSFLLQDTLRNRWGFRGYVVSDCGAIYDIQTGHHYTNDLAEAAATAVKAGCDLECGDAYKHLKEAVGRQLISEKTIDKSVERLLEARFRLGMFDPVPLTGPWKHISLATIDSSEHRNLALKAARESLVLLKNDGLLPLHGLKHIAVIGPIAKDTQIPLGNYNGEPSHLQTILAGIRAKAPAGTVVEYAQGSSLTDGLASISVPASALSGGVSVQYFKGENLKGAPVASERRPDLDISWGQSAPNPSVPATHFSARFTTTLIPPKSGEYSLGTRSDDGSRLKVDGKLVSEDWSIHPAKNVLGTIHLEAGHPYRIEVEYFQAEGEASISLIWSIPQASHFQEAVEVARRSDVTVLVLGISGALENEELDRKTLALPEVQQNLLAAVLKTGKPVVVVLENGSCIQIDPKPLAGLLEAWYPGEEGGTAVGEALFGKINPSGKLSETFYRSLDQLPAFDNYKLEGRTYRYMRKTPLFGFGYGLSYTKFSSTKCTCIPQTDGDYMVAATVKNTGSREGEEVVQVYAARKGAAWPEPGCMLVGFQRVHLMSGESKRLTIPIKNAFKMADANGHLGTRAGTYTVSVGGGVPGLESSTSGKDAESVVRVGI